MLAEVLTPEEARDLEARMCEAQAKKAKAEADAAAQVRGEGDSEPTPLEKVSPIQSKANHRKQISAVALGTIFGPEARSEEYGKSGWNISKKHLRPSHLVGITKTCSTTTEATMKYKRITHDERRAPFKNCIYCATDTRLLIDDVPVCLSCAKELQAGRKPRYSRTSYSANNPNSGFPLR